MRKVGSFLLGALLLAGSAAVSPPPAEANNPVRIFVDGFEVRYDVNPLVESGRTLVPLRGLSETMGFFVHYNDQDQSITLTKGVNRITLWVGSDRVLVGDEEFRLDVPVRTTQSRTFVPLRFLSERLGAHVHWDGAASAVRVTPNGALKLYNQSLTYSQHNMLENRRILVEGNMRLELNDGVERHVIEMPTTGDLHIHNREALYREVIGGTQPVTIQTVAKAGRIWVNNPQTSGWEQVDTYDITSGTAFFTSELFGGVAPTPQIHAISADAAYTYGGYLMLDGVETTRVDVRLGENVARALLDQIYGDMPGATYDVSRAMASVYINPHTGRTHKTDVEVAVGMTFTDPVTNRQARITGQMQMSARELPNPGAITWPSALR